MKSIFYIIIFAFFLRLVAIYCYGDFKNDFYWEYGEIAKNINHDKGYSLFYIDNSKLEYHFSIDTHPSKSAYMPPGYTYFLTPFIYITNITLRNAIIYFIQAVVSAMTIFLIYYLTKIIFNKKIAIIAALITAILPEFIYATLSFTPTIIYHFLVVTLLIIFHKFDSKECVYIYYLGIVLSIIIYFKSEFALFWVISIIFSFFQKKYKRSLQIFVIVFIIISPWMIRNYLTFGWVIPFTTSYGLNLYRGNNPDGIGNWGNKKIFDKINNINKENLEIELNNIYEREAITYILNNPGMVVKKIFTKIYYFWIFNQTDRRSYNPLYLFSSLIVLIFFVYGIASSFSWSKYKYFYLFIIYSNIIMIIFFPLLRYQTMMKITLIPFSAYGLELFFSYSKNKLFNKD